jgi:hypothetical protein
MKNVVQSGGEHLRKGHEADAHPGWIGGGIDLAEVLKERLQRRGCLRVGDAGTNTPDDCVAAGAYRVRIAGDGDG